MFIFLNKIIQKYKRQLQEPFLFPRKSLYESSRQGQTSRRGQIALIIIVFIAITFIFLTIVLNLGRISQTKTLTTIASNVSTSFMASAMASYAELLYQMQLGGPSKAEDDLTVCGWTGVAAAIFSILIIVASFFLPGSTPLAIAIISVILAVASLVLQLVVINPGLSDLWNKLMAEIKNPADQFVERGVIAGLQNVIDDNKQLPDNYDMDQDGIYGADDTVSRFGLYYTRRLKNAVTSRGVDPAKVQDFLNALGEFLYKSYKHPDPPVSDGITRDDNWGLWNPIDCVSDPSNACCSANPQPSECNPCCLPNGNAGEPNLRPTCCDQPGGCGTSTTCPSTNYPYVFDPLYEVHENALSFPAGAFISLREFLGHDDENRYIKDYPQAPDIAGIWRPNDSRGKLYSLLWSLGDRVRMDVPSPQPDRFCQWCDIKYGFPCTVDNSGLNLLSCDQGNIGRTNCCLDVKTDRVTDLKTATSRDVLLPATSCYDGILDNGWWKQGANQYCSTRYPYSNSCPGQFCSAPPTCNYCTDNPASPCYVTSAAENSSCITETNPAERQYWVEDSIDEVRYGLDDFIAWAKQTLDSDPTTIAATFTSWYPEADTWINTSSGKLAGWAVSINKWKNDLTNWRNYTSYFRETPGDLCPPSASPTPAGIQNIITCLNQAIVNEQNKANQFLSCYNKCKTGCSGTLPCTATSCTGGCVQADCNFLQPAWPVFGSNPAYVCSVWKYFTDSDTNVKKYQARRDFLQNLYNQVGDEIGGPPGTVAYELKQAKTKFDAFLSDPRVTAMKTEYDRMNTAIDNPAFEPYAVYIWQSDPPKNRPSEEGKWHIVRVDARLPGRCGGKCGRFHPQKGVWGQEPTWPWVKTYTKNAGTRRCYTLGDSFDMNGWCNSTGEYANNSRECFWGGTVKSRVIRYDEDKDLLLKFANNIPIWKFVSFHPLRGAADPTLVQQMVTACDIEGTGAYMLSNVSSTGTPADRACWDKVIPLLERGVMTKTCAEYFFHNQNPFGFNIKFTKCVDPF